jgi:oligopeptide/dipeptide ABC transporter ATP-binding protein
VPRGQPPTRGGVHEWGRPVSLLEVGHVTHHYARAAARPVLDDVSLGMEQDGLLAVVGESGCGKTTLGKLVAGLLRPSQGQVLFDGRDTSALRGDEKKHWRRQVQLVHQDPYASLNPGVNIASTLGPALVYHKLTTRRHLQTTLLDLMGQVGLDATPEFLRRYPHQLSGGQRQRVAIARAVSLGPRLIVADEVTSMLDVSLRVAILDLLLSFREKQAMAYLFISHDFGVVRYFTQDGRIMVMFYGVVVEEGPTEQVISSPSHPYTWALLQAIPVPDPSLVVDRAKRREVARQAEGEPATVGCIFSNRCPFAEGKCRTARPPLAEVGPGHKAACYFPERVPDVGYLSKDPNREPTRSGPIAGQVGGGAAGPVGGGPAGRPVEG